MSTFPASSSLSFFFTPSMIKCRQGGAARLKFIMVLRLHVSGVGDRGWSRKGEEEKVTGRGVSHA